MVRYHTYADNSRRQYNPLADRNWITGRQSTYFHEGLVSSFNDIAEFIAVHGQTLSYEQALFDEVCRGVDEFQHNVRRISNLNEWNIDSLLVRDEKQQEAGQKLRKPKIILNQELTSRGNLRLSWHLMDGYEQDFLFHGRYAPTRAYHLAPVNELIFFRHFADLLNSVDMIEASGEKKWKGHLRNYILLTSMDFLDKQIAYLETVFDVWLDNRIVTVHNDQGKIISWEMIDHAEVAKREQSAAKEKRAHKEAADLKAERDRLDAIANEQASIRAELEAYPNTYGIAAPRLAALLTAFSDARSEMKDTLSALNGNYGLRNVGDANHLETLARRVRKLLRIFDIEEDAPPIDRQQARELRDQARFNGKSFAKVRDQEARTKLEVLTGLKIERLLGLFNACVAVGVPTPKIGIVIRNHFGMNEFQNLKFAKVIARAERLRESLSIVPEQVTLAAVKAVVSSRQPETFANAFVSTE